MSPSRNQNATPSKSSTQPEPSSESQTDIAVRVQKDLKEASGEHEDTSPSSPVRHKATQFDGAPNPRGDKESGVFKPADDTPAVLPKRSGPKSGS